MTWTRLRLEATAVLYAANVKGYCWACDKLVWLPRVHRCESIKANTELSRIIQAGLADGTIQLPKEHDDGSPPRPAGPPETGPPC